MRLCFYLSLPFYGLSGSVEKLLLHYWYLFVVNGTEAADTDTAERPRGLDGYRSARAAWAGEEGRKGQ